MGMKYISKLPSPEEIIEKYPLREELKEKKKEFNKAVADIITGKSIKFLAIIGPCSADNEDSVLDYVTRLVKVADMVKDKIVVIPRVYTNKPRTTGDGYKGLLHQPNPEKKPDVKEGIIAIRKMHLKVIEETGLFTADEMLYPDNLGYLDDLLSYNAVGARSVENQQHRLTSSGIDVPVGMKNPTGGDLSVMLNAIYAAQQSHEFIYRNYAIKTDGNPLSHAILRGAVNKHGQCIPNYHFEDLKRFFLEAGFTEELTHGNDSGAEEIYIVHGEKRLNFSEVCSTGMNSLLLVYYWLKDIRIPEKCPSFICIDEFDAFYHFELSRFIVRKLKEINCQVLLTTHNTTLFTNDLLRPDCFYICSKDKIINAHNATEKELREGHNLEKLYRGGTFNNS